MWSVQRCPACGDPGDYCQGHGEIGDPVGFAVLQAHDAGDHDRCRPWACAEAPDHVCVIAAAVTSVDEEHVLWRESGEPCVFCGRVMA